MGGVRAGVPAERTPAMASLILTVVGPDRPGLVNALSHAVAARGGNWLESRMSRLGGQFAGIVLVEAPLALLDDLLGLESWGLRIVGQEADAPSAVPVGAPRLALLTTDVSSASFSGETLFRATAILRPPDDASMAALRAALEDLGNELMVDIQPAEQR
jgi:glycine cleavage system regulatory protein